MWRSTVPAAALLWLMASSCSHPQPGNGDAMSSGGESDATAVPPRPDAALVDAAAMSDAQAASGAEISVMQYNLYGWNALVQNPWKGENMVALINAVSPDFLGAQECEGRSNWVRDRLTAEYRIAGAEQHGVAIFYRSDRFSVASDGVVLINEMDQWGQRILRWARFVSNQTGAPVYVFTTHWCVCSDSQLRGTAATVAAAIADREHPEDPVILTGDLNVFEGFEDSMAIRYLKGEMGSPVALLDTFRVLHPNANGSTFGAAGKIDYVFASPGVQVLQAAIDRDSIVAGQGSDHDPVTATIRF